MLWSALYDKIGKQPLSVTQHTHVTAVIDGETVPLKLTFDEAHKMHFVPYETKERS